MTVLSNYDGYKIYITAPLNFTHRSEIVVIDGRTIDLRADVGLLTRNIVIQGDSNSETQLFGVHNVAMIWPWNDGRRLTVKIIQDCL